MSLPPQRSQRTSADDPRPADWHGRAAALAPDGRLVIDGERRGSAAGETFDKHSPIDGRRLGAVARGREADVDAAVKSARAAQPRA